VFPLYQWEAMIFTPLLLDLLDRDLSAGGVRIILSYEITDFCTMSKIEPLLILKQVNIPGKIEKLGLRRIQSRVTMVFGLKGRTV
jgi:hypothetical protein